jgi:ankyrin repeat protein
MPPISVQSKQSRHYYKRNHAFLFVLLLLVSVTAWSFVRRVQSAQRNYALLQAVKEAKRLYLRADREPTQTEVARAMERITQLLDEGADPNVRDCAFLPSSAWDRLLRPFLSWQPPVQAEGSNAPALWSLFEVPIVRRKRSAITSPHHFSWQIPIAMRNDEAMVRPLIHAFLMKGADVNARNPEDGTTLLLRALSERYPDCAMALIQGGAEVNAQDKSGNTPLMWAGANPQLWKALLNRGANVLLSNEYGFTALHDAVNVGDTALARAILERGANVNVRDGRGETPLYSASDLKTLNMLIAAGADVNAKNNEGETPLFRVRHRDIEVIRGLLNAGANIHARKNEGTTVLMEAAIFDEREKMELLIKHGAAVNASNYCGETALSRAKANGNTETIALLRKAGTH